MIASRRCIDALRRAAVRPVLDDLALAAEPSHADPADGIALRLTVERALARLSAVQRTTLRMAYGDGKSYREIAEETGVPTGTVKSRGRARARPAGARARLGVPVERRLRIGELARRTGTSPELLRAWEQRYGLFDPARTASGYRLYSAADEQRVRAMRARLAEGMSAAQAARAVRVAPATADALERLARGVRPLRRGRRRRPARPAAGGPFDRGR